MKRMHVAGFMIGVALLAAGCASSKRVNSSYDEDAIRDYRNIEVVAPALDLWRLEDAGPIEAEDQDSVVRSRVRARLAGFVARTGSDYHEWETLDSGLKASLQGFFDTVMASSSPDSMAVPEVLLAVGDSSTILYVRVQGSYKTKQRMRKEFWKALGIGIGTLGMVIPVYYPGTCRVQTILIDKKKARIVYAGNLGVQEDFRNEKVLNKLLDKSIDKYHAGGGNG